MSLVDFINSEMNRLTCYEQIRMLMTAMIFRHKHFKLSTTSRDTSHCTEIALLVQFQKIKCDNAGVMCKYGL